MYLRTLDTCITIKIPNKNQTNSKGDRSFFINRYISALGSNDGWCISMGT